MIGLSGTEGETNSIGSNPDYQSPESLALTNLILQRTMNNYLSFALLDPSMRDPILPPV